MWCPCSHSFPISSASQCQQAETGCAPRARAAALRPAADLRSLRTSRQRMPRDDHQQQFGGSSTAHSLQLDGHEPAAANRSTNPQLGVNKRQLFSPSRNETRFSDKFHPRHEDNLQLHKLYFTSLGYLEKLDLQQHGQHADAEAEPELSVRVVHGQLDLAAGDERHHQDAH